MRTSKSLSAVIILLGCTPALLAQSKPKLSLDEFFNSVSITALQLSPDGNSIVIGAERADWDQQIFRSDLWLYRAHGRDRDGSDRDDRDNDKEGESGSLIPLSQSGHDSEPKWSPDGRWLAFLSERKTRAEKPDDSDSGSSGDAKDDTSQIYLISPHGGEAIPLTEGEEEVHGFSWSADSQTIYFATRQPWSKTQKDDYKKEWKDVVQYRTVERGDTIFALNIPGTLARHAAAPARVDDDSEKDDITPGARAIATTALRVDDLQTSPDGRKLAFVSNAINQRQEKYDDVEIYVVDLSNAGLTNVEGTRLSANAGGEAKAGISTEPHRITNNTAVETHPRWANDSRHILFTVEIGGVSGPYRDLQPHLYWVDSESGKVEQWAKDFIGPVEHYADVGADAFVRPASAASSPDKSAASHPDKGAGSKPDENAAGAPRTHASGTTLLASARAGTEVQMYSTIKPSDQLQRVSHWPGTYSNISVASHSPRVAFIYSALNQPEEVYLADSPAQLDQAKPITSFNRRFTERDLPQGKPYQWKADDGTTVEGMLIYPPGKFEAKHLPMLTFIHGGPADAWGNYFEADWYQWADLAATNGWLVFEPNYRGSVGYGDKFLMQIVPQIVSRPGYDILEGVDALVKDGIADPDHLTIGGYSYGGYMTNWLITQTTRFKAAVTGAGAVEHIGNWGNDDTTYDDAYFLGGRPWEVPQRYHDEAAIFQIDKVRTPTHMVGGADDIRVAVLEDYLLEHALYSLGVPNKLLIFPGEGHSLAKNPWHGKIKVREELKWLQKYGGVPGSN
jgi:dipeptidyl aminopeptidase/acylaminoacyl peptidase